MQQQDKNISINELSREIHQNAVDKGFWDDKNRNLGEMLMLIVSELGEALEADRDDRWCPVNVKGVYGWKDDDSFATHFKETIKDTFEDEMADVMIRLLDLCEGKGIDLQYHVLAKMRYNKTRERLHGKAY